MSRRLLSACAGAVFLIALAVPNGIAAKPPDLPEDGTFTAEELPMPCEDSDITCPYLRQQRIDRHACQFADPQIGREVLENLERLKEADKLLEMAKELAADGFLNEAMECCDRAVELCPGSPCAQRAVDTLCELAFGIVPPTTGSEEAAEEQAEEPDVEAMMGELMKACHLLMSQGMHHQAAELARQAYALDPQRVLADPLIYKMHLLADTPATAPAGASEECEPPTCPYCGKTGKPILEIVPEKKKSDGEDATPPPAIDSDFEVGVKADGGLRLCADCSLGEHVYHLRYKHGCLAIWKTLDASRTKP